MSKKDTTKEVETTTAVATISKAANAIVAADDYMVEDLGTGFEGLDKNSFAIPFLKLAQKMSPEVEEGSGKFISGLKPGQFFNQATGEIYPTDNLYIVPCSARRTFIHWGGKDSPEGGFKGQITPEEMDALATDAKRIKEHNGLFFELDKDGKFDEKMSPYYSDTREHYILIVNPETGDVAQALLSLAATNIKPSRMFMTMLHSKKVRAPDGKIVTPPMFANLVKLTSVVQTKTQGNKTNTWSICKFELAGMTVGEKLGPDFGRFVYDMAKQFYMSIRGGQVDTDYSKMDPEKPTEQAGGEGQADEF